MARLTPRLAELAEDPEYHLEPPDGAEKIVDHRYCLVIGSERRWAGVCRLRIADEQGAVAVTVDEILGRVQGIEDTVWNIGPTAQPPSLTDRLGELRFRTPEPPWEPAVAAMVLADEPPGADGVEIRRIETFVDHLAGLEIMLAADSFTPERISSERALARQTFDRRMNRGGLQWLALVDGRPVAFAIAERSSSGLFLAGGATLPGMRGRGCYRALVRARWDVAVTLGLPGLAVQAQYGSSAPILRGLGFVETAVIRTFRSPLRPPDHAGTSRSPGEAGAPGCRGTA